MTIATRATDDAMKTCEKRNQHLAVVHVAGDKSGRVGGGVWGIVGCNVGLRVGCGVSGSSVGYE